MKEPSIPKAINIIRPHPKSLVRNECLNIKTNVSLHESKPTFHLYNPKKILQHSKPPPPLLKKPSIELYKPKKQLYMLQSKDQMTMSETNQVNNKENLYTPTQKEHIPNDSHTGDELGLPEPRINRKIADLEISNKSLLIINEMLESTVKSQAKQVASFRTQLQMTQTIEEANQQSPIQLTENEEQEEVWEHDEQFNRLRRITESLIEQGQRALVYQVGMSGRVLVTSNV
ncbi:uncharacterized protein B0P05DRAFT_520901 [Gilbertella persicaria]|uniref:uncharacterized protein n=1 Tax=Gilbertella persicaria TaxID=101096 RepID=UPI00222006AA|nr:uncharacterized protein B0P05DRAFT_520901 [Gilbertella persicaria]KAI8098205.1 hypothetical protein B0P05DRAFT_520901 [Gilbertella persicaria]